jgi:hypothetical protein
MNDLYDADFALWSERQAALLRRMSNGERVNDQVDWGNVAEEIESLGRNDRREIRSRLRVICEHLLKWRFQPEARSNSWRSSISIARDEIADLIEESPSLADYPATQLGSRRGAYARGRRDAAAETGLYNLPETCPWTIEQVLDHSFWLEGLSA